MGFLFGLMLRIKLLSEAFGVKIACGNLQGSQLLQAGLQRCCDGPAEGRSNPSALAI